MSVSILWLIAGALLLALEAFGLPGVGMLFAGLAALLTALLVEAGSIHADDTIAQWAVFLLATTLLAALLWKKLKTWRINPAAPRFRNMLGSEAVVANAPLRADTIGTVRWSGTLMQARLEPGTVAELPVGARTTITAVEGNVLTVAPKP